MDNPLAVYLHDHLAGSAFAIDLVESLQHHYADDELGQFAGRLLAEIQKDREVLQQLADHAGKAGASLKEGAAWISEKISRAKLAHDDQGLGTFQALEALALGILGKASLWRALQVLQSADDRLRAVDFLRLIARAQEQHAQVEEHRLQIAASALGG